MNADVAAAVRVVPVSDVLLDPAVNPRSCIDESVVSRYADALAAGEELPPLVVEAGTMRLLGGWHRLQAHRETGAAEVAVTEVVVPDGMPAKLFAASLNARHGLPLREDDARTLAREVYAADGGASVEAVARALGRARKTVEYWVREIADARREQAARDRQVRDCLVRLLAEAGWTQQRTANALGVSQKTVANIVSNTGEPAGITNDHLLRAAVDTAPDDAREAVATIARRWWEERLLATWSPAERDLRERLLAGETVVVNMRGDGHPRLWEWAEHAGLAVRIDRKSVWGNPFVLDEDGTRDEVCDAYERAYWPHKPSLHARVAALSGKALGCWCAPARCHGDFLAAAREGAAT